MQHRQITHTSGVRWCCWWCWYVPWAIRSVMLLVLNSWGGATNEWRYMGPESASATLTNSLSDLTNTLAAKCHCRTHTHILTATFSASLAAASALTCTLLGRPLAKPFHMLHCWWRDWRRTTKQRRLFADKQHRSGLSTNNVNYQRLYTSLSCRIITQHLPLQQIWTSLYLRIRFFFASSPSFLLCFECVFLF